MDRQQRAKQFAPFDALKGFREALREKEKVVVPKVELSEDKKEELDFLLQTLKKEDTVTVIYYNGEEYVQVTGIVTQINTSIGYLKVVEMKIAFRDIRDSVLYSRNHYNGNNRSGR